MRRRQAEIERTVLDLLSKVALGLRGTVLMPFLVLLDNTSSGLWSELPTPSIVAWAVSAGVGLE